MSSQAPENRLYLDIDSCDNGYIVRKKYHQNHVGQFPEMPIWIATSPEDLANLIKKIAKEHRVEK